MVGVERSGLPMTTVAKIVTAENLAEVNAQVKAGRLRVALPIFGVKQKLSQGVMGEIEREVLEAGRHRRRRTCGLMSYPEPAEKEVYVRLLLQSETLNCRRFSECRWLRVSGEGEFYAAQRLLRNSGFKRNNEASDLIAAGF